MKKHFFSCNISPRHLNSLFTEVSRWVVLIGSSFVNMTSPLPNTILPNSNRQEGNGSKKKYMMAICWNENECTWALRMEQRWITTGLWVMLISLIVSLFHIPAVLPCFLVPHSDNPQAIQASVPNRCAEWDALAQKQQRHLFMTAQLYRLSHGVTNHRGIAHWINNFKTN